MKKSHRKPRCQNVWYPLNGKPIRCYKVAVCRTDYGNPEVYPDMRLCIICALEHKGKLARL